MVDKFHSIIFGFRMRLNLKKRQINKYISNLYANLTIKIIVGIIITFCLSFFLYGLFMHFYPNIFASGELENIQSSLLFASSIIIAVLISFLISKHFEISKIRREKTLEYIGLTEEIAKNMEVYWHLASYIQREYKLNPSYPYDLRRALTELQEYNKEEKQYGNLFLIALNCFSSNYYDYLNFNTQRKLLLKDTFKEKEMCISQLSGLFAREKHYKHILSDLGFHDANLDTNVLIKNSSFLQKEYVEKIMNDEIIKHWQYFTSWIITFDEVCDKMEHMKRLLPYIFDFRAEMISKQIRLLYIISIFGIFLPLLLLGFSVPDHYELLLTYISFFGFSLLFIYTIHQVYIELSKPPIWI